jgi:steroid Delta-isomerase
MCMTQVPSTHVDAAAHVEAFNQAVTSGDWGPFVERFACDAVLEFVGPPVGPFVGRKAIAAAYSADPPDDTIAPYGEPFHSGDELVVPYRWSSTGATGTMRLTALDSRISRLVVTFD